MLKSDGSIPRGGEKLGKPCCLLPVSPAASRSNLHMEGAVSGGASLLLVPPSCCRWLYPSLGSRVVFFPVNLYFPTSIVILIPRISWGNRWKCLL